MMLSNFDVNDVYNDHVDPNNHDYNVDVADNDDKKYDDNDKVDIDDNFDNDDNKYDIDVLDNNYDDNDKVDNDDINVKVIRRTKLQHRQT